MVTSDELCAFSGQELERLIEEQVRKIQLNNVLAEQKKIRLQTIQNETKILTEKKAQMLAAKKKEEESVKKLENDVAQERSIVDHLHASLSKSQEVLSEKRNALDECNRKIQELSDKLLLNRQRKILHAKRHELKQVEEKCVALEKKLLPQHQPPLEVAKATSGFGERPKAAVEPFLHHHQSNSQYQQSYLNSKGFLTAFNAVEEVLRQEEKMQIFRPPWQAASRRFCLTLSSPTTETSEMPPPSSSDDAPPPDLIPTNEKQRPSATSSGFCGSSAGGGGANGNVLLPPPPLQLLSSLPDPDRVALRQDTLRAVKRRSWADPWQQHGGHAHLQRVDYSTTRINKAMEDSLQQQQPFDHEAEHIKAVLRREQQKGKSTVNLSWIFGQLPHGDSATVVVSDKPDIKIGENGEKKKEVEMCETTDDPSEEPADLPPTTTEIDLDDSWTIPPLTVVADVELAKKSYEHAHAEIVLVGDRTSSADVVHEENVNFSRTIILHHQDNGVAKKGILRKVVQPANPGQPPLFLQQQQQQKRIRFDPLALLLDAALEGELALVKWCAQQLGTVNQSNGEGITALHNAICAGHYEIVRFLIEADADVNAQDTDGWTPLHCAASCNNLPAVQFLVERGACVFAQTTNDLQTPLDKCEEDCEGFDGCSQYLRNIQEKMGTMLNHARVYAAFDYDAENEDELTFQSGDEFVVIDRHRQNVVVTVQEIDVANDSDNSSSANNNNVNFVSVNENETVVTEDKENDHPEMTVVDKTRTTLNQESHWWLVKKVKSGDVGLAPRNFLALYPKLSIQRQWNTKVEINNGDSLENKENV